LAGAGSGTVCALMPMVLDSYLRLVTSPKIFKRPTPIEEAIGFVDALLSLPGVQVAELGPEWKRLHSSAWTGSSAATTFKTPGR
jgi:hypothetical protein